MQAPTTLSVVLGKRSSDSAAPAAKSFKRSQSIVGGEKSLFLFDKRCDCYFSDDRVWVCRCQHREIVVFSETLHPELFQAEDFKIPGDECVDMVLHIGYGIAPEDPVTFEVCLRAISERDDEETDCDLYYDLGYFEHDNYSTAHELLLALNDWVDSAFRALEIEPTDDRSVAFWSAFGGRMMMEIASMIVLHRGGEVYFPPSVYLELGRPRIMRPYSLPVVDGTFMYPPTPPSPTSYSPASPPPCDEFIDITDSSESESSDSDSDF